MSLIPRMPAEPERDVLTARVPTALLEQLRDYATFVRGTKDYVITAALERLFKQDREFIQWRQSQTSSAEKTAAPARSAASASSRSATPGPAQGPGTTESSIASAVGATAPAPRTTQGAATQTRTASRTTE